MKKKKDHTLKLILYPFNDKKNNKIRINFPNRIHNTNP